MDSLPKRKFVLSKYFIGLIILWGIYALLSILAPSAQTVNRYGLSLAQTNLLRATVVVPYFFIWLAALFAVLRFRNYWKIIADSAESPAFKHISLGLTFLMLVVVIPPFIGLVSSYYPNVPDVLKTVTIVRNYATVALYLVAFYYLWRASLVLNGITGSSDSRRGQFYSTIVVVIVASLYMWFILHNPFRTSSSDPLVRPTYYLPDWLILLTIVLPYILIWTLGALSIVNIRDFAHRVQGVIYRKVFNNMARGLILVVILVVTLQLISQATTFFGRASLNIILVIIYPLLILIGAAYLYLARGAKALTKIEEV